MGKHTVPWPECLIKGREHIPNVFNVSTKPSAKVKQEYLDNNHGVKANSQPVSQYNYNSGQLHLNGSNMPVDTNLIFFKNHATPPPPPPPPINHVHLYIKQEDVRHETTSHLGSEMQSRDAPAEAQKLKLKEDTEREAQRLRKRQRGRSDRGVEGKRGALEMEREAAKLSKREAKRLKSQWKRDEKQKAKKDSKRLEKIEQAKGAEAKKLTKERKRKRRLEVEANKLKEKKDRDADHQSTSSKGALSIGNHEAVVACIDLSIKHGTKAISNSKEAFVQQVTPLESKDLFEHHRDLEIQQLKIASKKRSIEPNAKRDLIRRLNSLMLETGKYCRTCFNGLMPRDQNSNSSRCSRCRWMMQCYRCYNKIHFRFDERMSVDRFLQEQLGNSDEMRISFTCSDCSQYCRRCMKRFREPVYHELVKKSLCPECKGVKHFRL